FDVGDDGLVVGVTERRVDLVNVAVLYAFGMQEGAQDLVSGARVNVIGSQQHKALRAAAVFTHQVFNGRNGLLVGRGSGVEDVAFKLFAFILNGVEQQPVELLENRQHRFARHRCPGAEYDGDFVLRQQLARLVGEEGPV